MSKKKEILLEGSLRTLLEEKNSESFESFEIVPDEQPPGEQITDEQVFYKQPPDEPIESDEPDLEIESMPEGSGDTTIIVDDVEILQSFIQESQDHLENIEEKILKLEAEYDPDVVGDIFRSMHTMKGTSSYFGFEKIKELSHTLESILDDLRSEKIKISSELVDILLEGTDLLSRMIGALRNSISAAKGSSGTLEIQHPDIDIAPILSRIQESRSKGETKEDLVTDELVDKFLSETMDLLDSTEKSILDLENRPEETESLDNAFRCIHTIKGNAGFMGYGDLEKICMETESVLDAIRQGERKVSPKVVTILLGSLDTMKKALDFSTIEDEETDKIETAESPKEDEEEQEVIKPLGEILIDIGAATPEAVDNALDIQDKRLGEILLAEGKVSED
ncbi:Hpt domain-containing protein, partial [bacterium]|nr:Hpt domain-containing protein [bacterium]